MYYDQEHQLHHLVGMGEVEQMFGVDAVRKFWGGTERSREAIALLRKLQRLPGLNWVELGDMLGAGKSSVYRWLSGDSDPRNDTLERLRQIAAEYERSIMSNDKTNDKKTIPFSKTRPNEYERMPVKRHV